MAVETARAEAKKAEQVALTAEAEGKALVMKVKYEKEQEKIAAVTEAEKEKQVAELNAQRGVEVSKLRKEAAEYTKAEQELLGQDEAARKAAILKANGALAQKLEALIQINRVWAQAYSQRAVPKLQMGGGTGNNDQATLDFSQAMQLLVAKQLGVDLGIKE